MISNEFNELINFMFMFNIGTSCAMCAAVKPPLPGPAFTNCVGFCVGVVVFILFHML